MGYVYKSGKVSSGALMQFLSRDDFLNDGIPSLGFYGQFSPLVQPYSCAESPLWLGKAFLCLTLPPNDPFWTATENNGCWDKLDNYSVKQTTLDGPALCFTNHEANGETILRTGKVVKNCGDTHGMWNYSKLCFNSKYPWESSPSKDIEAMQYVLKDLTDEHYEKCNVTLWNGAKNYVLYRRQFFNYELTKESLKDFSDDELFPISAVEYTDARRMGGYGKATIRLKNGAERIIQFEGIEGRLEL